MKNGVLSPKSENSSALIDFQAPQMKIFVKTGRGLLPFCVLVCEGKTRTMKANTNKSGDIIGTIFSMGWRRKV
jgi:hypothetical protein